MTMPSAHLRRDVARRGRQAERSAWQCSWEVWAGERSLQPCRERSHRPQKEPDAAVGLAGAPVGAPAMPLAVDDFGRQVLGRAAQCVRLVIQHQLRESKVDQLQVPVLVDEQVIGHHPSARTARRAWQVSRCSWLTRSRGGVHASSARSAGQAAAVQQQGAAGRSSRSSSTPCHPAHR